jgi:hypothetical protein
MSAANIAIVQLEDQAATVVDRARALKVIDQPSYDRAAERLLAVADLRRQITDHHEPIKRAAHAAWQQVIAAEKRLLDPVAEAERILKRAIGDYQAEQQRLEAARIAEAEAEARRQAEEQRERELEAAEAQGADAEEIAAMCNVPLIVEPPRVEPTFQPAKGVSMAANWKGEVTSLEVLVKAIAAGKANLVMVIPNDVAINQIARATRGTLQVPGIRFFNQATIRAGRR